MGNLLQSQANVLEQDWGVGQGSARQLQWREGWQATQPNIRPPPPNHVDKLVLVTRLDGVKDKSGLTVEGLQEYYDEACLAVLNNRSAKSISLTPLTPLTPTERII